MGFELAGTHDVHRVAIGDLPTPTVAGGLPAVGLVDVERDLAGIRALYERWASPHTGPVSFDRDEDWRRRVLASLGDETFRSVVARDGDRVLGLLSFSRVAAEGHLDVAFGLDCRAFVATTGPGLDALLAYIGGYAGLGRWIRFAGPPNDALSLRLPAQSLEVHERYRWMLRLLNVPAAFEARGYPPVDAEVTFSVDDHRYPDNGGPWRLMVRDGRGSIERAVAHDRAPIPIGPLSSMFSGYFRPHDAVLLGVMAADDPAVEGFATILAGPDPWNPFFF
jgi:predicted acetyltransferase